MNKFVNDENDRLLYLANLIFRLFIPGFDKWYKDRKYKETEMHIM